MRDKPSEIAEDLSLRIDSLKLLGDYVLVEVNQQETMVGSLYVPPEALESYPTSGWVCAIGTKVKEEIAVGDFVLLEEEGIDLDQTYYDIFEVILRLSNGSLESIWPEIEIEPVLRAEVSAFRRGGGPDSQLSMQDRKGNTSISFNCSDVVDWQFAGMANPSYSLTYVPVHMYIFLNEEDIPALFYITRVRKIISVVEY